FVSSTGFDFWEFSYTATSCIVGVLSLSAAVVGYFIAPMTVVERVLCAIAGLVFIAPSLQADMISLAIVAPVAVMQILAKRRSANAVEAN
ncbi:MAG: TRAP transporter permease, partial [Pseudomonadota bacterium]